MESHEKGRIIMNSDNKSMIALGAFVAGAAAILCIFKGLANCSCCCSGKKGKK